jgi:hypothetical protein
MNRETSSYDPMSLQPDVDAITSSPGFKQHHEAIKSVTQESKYKRAEKTITVNVVDNEEISRLFGKPLVRAETEVAPSNATELDNDAATEDEVTVVQDS